MKTILTSTAAGLLLAAFAVAQEAPRYTVIDLNTSLPKGWSSQATFVSNNRVVTGIGTDPGGTQHAVLWNMGLGLKVDIDTKALGGANSGAFGINERGEAEIQVETSAKDPNNENFCGYGTGLKCVVATWQGGVLAQLPLLGGNNGTIGWINNRGEVAGVAENAARDPNCPGAAPNGAGLQVLDYDAVIWGPGKGDIRKLAPLPGDTVGMAFSINDNGQAVGFTGTCANSVLPPSPAGGAHAVLWEKDGSAHDLGDFGGTVDPALFGVENVAFVINNAGQVTGSAVIPTATGEPSANHAFLWVKGAPLQDLGTLPGRTPAEPADVQSAGLGMNDSGQVVGGSIDAAGNPRAFLWQQGAMTGLNTISPGSPLYLLFAYSINASGEITGLGMTNEGDLHGFLAIPQNRASGSGISSSAAQGATSAMVFYGDAHKLLQRRLPLSGFGARPAALR